MKLYEHIITYIKIFVLFFGFLRFFFYLCTIKLKFITHLCYKTTKILKALVVWSWLKSISHTSSHDLPGSNSNHY